MFAGLSAISLIPASGDALKAAGKVGAFIFKNIDTPSDVAIVVKFINENFPDVAKKLGKIDNMKDAAKALAKLDNIKLTKKQMKAMMKGFDDAGLGKYLIKTSDDLDIKRTIGVSEEIWSKWPFSRGQDIDNIVNDNSGGKRLGKTFPVVDRLTDDRCLVSTKSLDVGSQCYQSSGRLEKILKDYLSDLRSIEAEYMKNGKMTWGKVTLKVNEYDTKVLEIVLPDAIINQKNLSVLKDFVETSKESNIEVWYLIGK